MEIRYELTPEEFVRSSLACDRLDPIRSTAMAVRWASAAMAALAGALAIGCGATGSWAGAAFAGAATVATAAFFVLTSDRYRDARNAPEGPVPQGLRFTDEGLVDLVRARGPRTHPWAAVERVVDLGWAWFVGVGGDEWLVIPRRTVPEDRLAWVPAELRRRTGKEIEPLP